jgi:hypothetical protein
MADTIQRSHNTRSPDLPEQTIIRRFTDQLEGTNELEKLTISAQKETDEVEKQELSTVFYENGEYAA